MAAAPAPIIEPLSALGRLDVIIEMHAQLHRAWVVELRKRGGKIVSMRVGNDYVLDTERMVFNLPHAGLILQVPFDAMNAGGIRTLLPAVFPDPAVRALVRIVPHIWSPMLLEKDAKSLPEGVRFGYTPGQRNWRVGVFEPNVSIVKTSHISLLSYESADRRKPDMFHAVRVFGTMTLK
ncbi:hypothetical protein BPMI_00868 [Candidatus Burkholderia pumila]|uniref:Uncharacterized protein n=1 Tax=Candidatus Burkholderia pumila TaxID=1090375 RepID=A0ABR5HM95_9BURK|nr:hypothetical protein BPMI_00868 [Candidatus Burkholderia pumila]